MILTIDDITRIIKDNPNKALVQQVQEYSAKLTMHITGVGLCDYIEKLEYFEKQELYQIRVKYTRSNKDFFSRLHRPIDKIYNANGGSTYYDLPDANKSTFIKILQDVEWGHNLRGWIKTFWEPALHYDPMGLIFMEVDSKGDTYPTYKTSASVYDYQLTGRKPEYIVFKTDQKITDSGQTKTVYRVVDDAMDYLVTWDGNVAVILQDKSFTNYYDKVPAWIMSDIYDPQRGFYISPDDNIVELADQYLREGGILNVFKNNFGFPQRWRYKGDCDKCGGEGVIGGEVCTACNGTKSKMKYDVSQDINLPIPTKEDPILAPPAGNIESPVASWDKMDSSLDSLFNLAYYTKWGVTHSTKVSGVDSTRGDVKTATEIVMDEQPKIEALYAYSTAAEKTEKSIADYMGTFYFQGSYKGADINYGRRFTLEGPDTVLDSLMGLIQKQAPYEVIREKMEEYYATLYQGDSVKLNTALKLIDVEPLPFYSMTLAKTLLSPLEYAKKQYYNDWRGLKSTKDSLIKTSVEDLRKSLLAYTLDRVKEDTALMPPMVDPNAQQMQAA